MLPEFDLWQIVFLLQAKIVELKPFGRQVDQLVSRLGLVATEVTLVFAHFSAQGLDDSFLREDSVFLATDALLDALSMATDLELKVVFALGFAFSQSVKVFNLEQLGLDDAELQVEVLRLLARHRQPAVQLVESLFEGADSVVGSLEDVDLNVDLVDALQAEQSRFQRLHLPLLSLFDHS